MCTCYRVLGVDLSRWVLDSTRSGSGRKRNLRWQVGWRDDVGDLKTAMLVIALTLSRTGLEIRLWASAGSEREGEWTGGGNWRRSGSAQGGGGRKVRRAI